MSIINKSMGAIALTVIGAVVSNAKQVFEGVSKGDGVLDLGRLVRNLETAVKNDLGEFSGKGSDAGPEDVASQTSPAGSNSQASSATHSPVTPAEATGGASDSGTGQVADAVPAGTVATGGAPLSRRQKQAAKAAATRAAGGARGAKAAKDADGPKSAGNRSAGSTAVGRRGARAKPPEASSGDVLVGADQNSVETVGETAPTGSALVAAAEGAKPAANASVRNGPSKREIAARASEGATGNAPRAGGRGRKATPAKSAGGKETGVGKTEGRGGKGGRKGKKTDDAAEAQAPAVN